MENIVKKANYVLKFELPITEKKEEKLSKVEKQTQEGTEEKWIVEAFVATTDKDMEEDKITPGALKQAAKILKENFQTVLFNHNPNYPIGKVVDAKVKNIPERDAKGLWVKIYISKQEWRIWQKIKEGVLSKFSISAYAVRKPVYSDKEDEEGRPVIDYYEITELYPFECSLVSVPANPNAVAISWYIEKQLIPIEEYKKEEEEEMKEEIKKEAQTNENSEKANEKNDKPVIHIDTESISYTPWSAIDKTKLARILFESGDEKAIKECFGVVPDINKRSTWKFPHHVLIKRAGENEYDLVLSYTGLMAAYKAFRGARREPKLTPQQRKDLKAHLRRHFEFLVRRGEYEEVPEALKMLARVAQLDLALDDLREELQSSGIEDKIASLEQIDSLVEEILKKDFKFYSITRLFDIVKFEELEEKISEKFAKILEETLKNLLKGKEDAMEKEKSLKTEANKEEVKKEVLEEKDKYIEELKKTISSLQEEVKKLKAELEELKKSPEVKGMDSQREEETFDVEEFIKSEEFANLPLEKQMEFLRLLFEKANAKK